jgi:SWIM zinc finger.
MRREDPLRRAVESLSSTFPGKSRSWIRRALMRLGDVEEVRENLYVVYGRRELGDWKQMYQVWYSEREGRWYCTCFTSAFGYRRSREICTHVAAVMLYRRYRRALQRLEDRRVYVAEADVECGERPGGQRGAARQAPRAEGRRGGSDLLHLAEVPRRGHLRHAAHRDQVRRPRPIRG